MWKDTKKITFALVILFVFAEANGWSNVWKWAVGVLSMYDLVLLGMKFLKTR